MNSLTENIINPNSQLRNQSPFRIHFYGSHTDDSRTGEIRLTLKDIPWLSDHAFRDMIVLPGSAYVEMAMELYSLKNNSIPYQIRNINFGTLIILSEKESIIKFKIMEADENNTLIEFFENEITDNGKEIFKTSLELIKTTDAQDHSEKLDSSHLTGSLHSQITPEELYTILKRNGNQYGPSFRNIVEIQAGTDSVVCKLDFSNLNIDKKEFLMNPGVLDSFTQVLSCLTYSKGKTFILKSISSIHLFNIDFPENLRAYGRINSSDNILNDGYEGDISVFNAEGEINLLLSGVKFKYLDISKDSASPDGTICIASTFTAEPVEESLKYWISYFGMSYEIQFSPYNQVFQELLNPDSFLKKNNKGLNVIFLKLDDWAKQGRWLRQLVSNEEKEQLFGNKSRYILPGNLDITHLNGYETDYVYNEIFNDRSYLKHGIDIKDGDTVIDIGANIGLFTLFVNQYCLEPVVYSFEPSPIVYELLKANCAVYGSRVKTFNLGVSDKKKSAAFTFYRNSSVFSGFNPDEEEDYNAIKKVAKNMLGKSGISGSDSVDDLVDHLTAGRVEKESYECGLLSVSDIISENNIERIDLLKIDAEKSELDIINGISDDDWIKIRQIVIEIHDKSGSILDRIDGILKSKGFVTAVEEEEMLKGSGLFNVYAKRKDETLSKSSADLKLSETINDFAEAVTGFKKSSKLPLVIAVLPGSPGMNYLKKEILDKYEKDLLEKLNSISETYTISSSDLLNYYNGNDYFDPMGNTMGHIPYSPPFFTAIGTSLFRSIISAKLPQKKVIALDCDNTLWKGVCGEDGPDGIRITPPFKAFQQFLADVAESGTILCLCSKNNEEDVFEVFRKRNDMVLKKEHIAAWKINWENKSSNLLELSKELNLGLDSFILIDDNPVECAEVRSACDEVLTLMLPDDEDKIGSFIRNVRLFSKTQITDEDKKRTRMYRENLERERYRSNSMNLRDFIRGLDLRIKISNPEPGQISRISQLTYRTNQFNFTTIRRSESEVLEFLSDKKNGGLVVEVSDRFGDYGLVGVLLYSKDSSLIKIDTFLLSCRVLGRGVEYKILNELGKRALAENISSIEIKYTASAKNKPARDFIEKVKPSSIKENSQEFISKIPSEILAELDYENYLGAENPVQYSELEGSEKESESGVPASDKVYEFINDLSDPSIIHNRVEEFRMKHDPTANKSIILPGSELEQKVTTVWQKVLGVKEIGIDDNFLESGGSSLKAVQLIAALKKEMNVDMSIVDLFECPTIRTLAKKLSPVDETVSPSAMDSGMERASQRRNQNLQRKGKK